MKDAFGKELAIGDRVVYIKKVAGSGSSVKLAKGTVKDIKRTGKNAYATLSSHNYGVTSQSVMKIEPQTKCIDGEDGYCSTIHL